MVCSVSEKCFTLLDFNLVFWSELYGHSDEAFLCTNWMVLNKLIILYSTWTVLCCVSLWIYLWNLFIIILANFYILELVVIFSVDCVNGRAEDPYVILVNWVCQKRPSEILNKVRQWVSFFHQTLYIINWLLFWVLQKLHGAILASLLGL